MRDSIAPEISLKEEDVRSTCQGLVAQLPAVQHDTLALAFMRQFAGLSKSFADDPANHVSDPSEKGRRWDRFFAWVITELQRQIEAENERVQRESAEVATNGAEAMRLLGAAGVAFIVFVFFTLMLVLIAIERNTRTHLLSASPGVTRESVTSA